MQNDFDMRGHTYDLDLLAAPMHHLLAHHQLDTVMGRPEMGRPLARIGRIRMALQLRADDVHAVALVRPDGRRLCSCGLLLPLDAAVEDAEGHLDLRHWRQAGTYVVRTDEGRLVAACQCGWRSVCEEEPAARDAARLHRDEHGWS